MMLVVSAVGLWQLTRDRSVTAQAINDIQQAADDTPEAASTTGTGSPAAASVADATPGATQVVADPEPMLVIDDAVLAGHDFKDGYLVFADAARTHIEVVDLATGRRTPTDLSQGARLRAVSDLGLIVESGGSIVRHEWAGTITTLASARRYLGGNTVAIARIPSEGEQVYFEYDEGDATWAERVPRGSSFFVLDDSMFTSSRTEILRVGPGERSWEPIGDGAISGLIGNGLIAFDCVTGRPDIDSPCLMDIYRADGSLAASSRTASQLRWNITAGGRADAGLVLSHGGEMLAEPTQVGLGVWNTTGGTLRRIADIPLDGLQWTPDDSALVGLGPSIDGWAAVMELDIARGTPLPVGIEVTGMELVGFGHTPVSVSQ